MVEYQLLNGSTVEVIELETTLDIGIKVCVVGEVSFDTNLN